VNAGLIVAMSFVLVIAGGASGAAVALWMSSRYYDQGYRAGLIERQPPGAPFPRTFRLPRRLR
jgi:hypothetical protein